MHIVFMRYTYEVVTQFETYEKAAALHGDDPKFVIMDNNDEFLHTLPLWCASPITIAQQSAIDAGEVNIIG